MIELRVELTDSQADRVQQRISALPFKVAYQEEQHGASLIAVIRCTESQQPTVQQVLQDAGASINDSPQPD